MKIMLDAGHGYSVDTGAEGNGLKEQDITYTLAQKVGEKLRNAGIEVMYTRNNITDNVGNTLSESINGRYIRANNWGADYFISIHCNAFSDPSANGTETLIYAKGGKAEWLALNVHTHLVQLGLTDRGVKVRTDLGVLKNTKMPAILVETAFITNEKDSCYLTIFQDEVVDAIANGIFEFLGITVGKEDTMSKFNDISGHWAEKVINELSEMGIVNGDGNGNFRPNDNITRAEAATMVRNAVRYITGK